MGQFLTNRNFQKLIKKQDDNLNSLLSSKEVEFVLKHLPKGKTSGPVVSLANSTTHLMEKLHQFLTISLGNRKVVSLPNSLYKVTVTLILNHTKIVQENCKLNTPLEYRCKSHTANIKKKKYITTR